MSQLTLPANLSLPANLEQLLTQFLQAQLPKPIQLDPSVLAYRWQSNSRMRSGVLVPLTV
ncbi:type I restriction endonuclease, partial [bacterium M00.F.Ca.ET.230.01.1.1]